MRDPARARGAVPLILLAAAGSLLVPARPAAAEG